MKVLVACEESQEVCKAFRNLGQEAYSCDIQEPSGGHPEWHILGDALAAIEGGHVYTMDGEMHTVGKWDLIIAHPPCTYLTVTGNRWFNVERYGSRAIARKMEREKAINFFMRLAAAECEHVAIENPVGIMSSVYRKPDQIIQPYYFGDRARKGTCLWLKNLPFLVPTNMIDPGEILPGGYSVGASANYARDEHGKILAWNDPRTAKARSKTFPGIARAMAEQWGAILKD